MIIILLFAFIIRLIGINQSLWLDEATSVLAARNFSVNEIIQNFSPGDFHPPLYYVMLKGWILLFGSSEIAVRSLSVIFGVATVYLIYEIGRRLFNKRVGVVASLFLATAPLHVYYSQEARMYVPAAFFVTLAILFFIVAIQSGKKCFWFGWIIAMMFAIYLDYVPLFMLPVFIIFVFTKRGWKDKNLILVVMSVFLLLLIPLIPILLEQVQLGLSLSKTAPLWAKVLGGISMKELLLVPVKFMIGRISFYNKVQYTFFIAVYALLFTLALIKSFVHWKKTWLVLMWLFVPLLAAIVFSLKLSIFSYFRFIFILPAFYILTAFGVVSFENEMVRKSLITCVLLANIVAVGIHIVNPGFHREDWRGAVYWIENNSIGKNAGAIFVTKNQRDPYFYYQKSVMAFGPEGLQKNFDTLWLMRYVQPIFDPQDKLRQQVENTGYKKIDEKDFNGVTVWEYIYERRN